MPAAALGNEIASCDSILSLHFLGTVSGLLGCKGRLGGWPHSLRCPPWAERAARPGAGGASEPQVTPRVNHPRGSAEAAAAAAAAAVAVTLCAPPRSSLAAGPARRRLGPGSLSTCLSFRCPGCCSGGPGPPWSVVRLVEKAMRRRLGAQQQDELSLLPLILAPAPKCS